MQLDNFRAIKNSATVRVNKGLKSNSKRKDREDPEVNLDKKDLNWRLVQAVEKVHKEIA